MQVIDDGGVKGQVKDDRDNADGVGWVRRKWKVRDKGG